MDTGMSYPIPPPAAIDATIDWPVDSSLRMPQQQDMPQTGLPLASHKRAREGTDNAEDASSAVSAAKRRLTEPIFQLLRKLSPQPQDMPQTGFPLASHKRARECTDNAKDASSAVSAAKRRLTEPIFQLLRKLSPQPQPLQPLQPVQPLQPLPPSQPSQPSPLPQPLQPSQPVQPVQPLHTPPSPQTPQTPDLATGSQQPIFVGPRSQLRQYCRPVPSSLRRVHSVFPAYSQSAYDLCPQWASAHRCYPSTNARRASDNARWCREETARVNAQRICRVQQEQQQKQEKQDREAKRQAEQYMALKRQAAEEEAWRAEQIDRRLEQVRVNVFANVKEWLPPVRVPCRGHDVARRKCSNCWRRPALHQHRVHRAHWHGASTLINLCSFCERQWQRRRVAAVAPRVAAVTEEVKEVKAAAVCEAAPSVSTATTAKWPHRNGKVDQWYLWLLRSTFLSRK